MISKNRPQLKPSKPSSGYNIFYQSESKRARDRERARKLYLSCSSCNKPEHEQPANKTRFIGNKWKNLSQHEQELFYVRVARINLTCTRSTNRCGPQLTRCLVDLAQHHGMTRVNLCMIFATMGQRRVTSAHWKISPSIKLSNFCNKPLRCKQDERCME